MGNENLPLAGVGAIYGRDRTIAHLPCSQFDARGPGRWAGSDQLQGDEQARTERRSIDHIAILEFGHLPHLQPNVIEGAPDSRPPRHDCPSHLLQCLDPIVSLVVDLVDMDELEIVDALLEIMDAFLEEGPLVVSDDGGVVLGGAVQLQRRDPFLRGVILLLSGGLLVSEALLPFHPPLVEVVKPLEQFVEHAAHIAIHGSPCPL